MQSAGIVIQRMQKALVQMNLQLPLVVSDITGVTGLRVLRDTSPGNAVVSLMKGGSGIAIPCEYNQVDSPP